MKVSGCVFDFGGVMTTATMPDRVRAHVGELGVSWEVLVEGFARYRRLMDGGFITMDEMYSLIWADAGIKIDPAAERRLVEEDMSSFVYRSEATLEFMRSLKAEGFAVGMLTNMAPCFVPLFREHFGDFIDLADAMVISGQERMFKPQRRIYDLLRERIGLPAGELCFFDDSEANCEGARAAGWRAIRFTGVDEAARAFREIAAG